MMPNSEVEDEDATEAAERVAEREEKEAGTGRRGRDRELRSSDEELPPLLDRSRLEADFNRNAFDFPGRPVVDLDKEINQRNLLYGTVSKYRFNDEAQVTITRMLPETWEGQETKGFSDRYHVNTFQTADDLLTIIKRTFGGYLYNCVFTAPNKAGEMKTVATCKVHINAPPIVQSTPMGQASKTNGHGTAPNPNMEIVDRVLKTQQDIISQQKKEAEDPRMLAQMTNIVREMRAANEATLSAIMKTQQSQIDNLMKQSEHASKPDTGLIKFTSEQAVAERDRLQARFDMEKSQLIAYNNQQIENAKRDAQQQIDFVRRDKEAEIARMQAQITTLENQNALMKLTLETNFNTQLNNMKATYENQIANAKSSNDLQMTLNLNRIQVLEAQVKTLEEQRTQLLTEKISDAKNRPDSLSAMAGTMAAVKELAGAMGLQRDDGSSEPELVTTLKALKDIGIGDTIGRIAERLAPKPAAPPPGLPPGMQPVGVYRVPVNAQGVPLVPPPDFSPPPPQPTQRRAPVVASPMPQVNVDEIPPPHPAAPPPPAEAPEAPPLSESLNPEALKMMTGIFERAMNENWPMNDLANEVIKAIPHTALIAVVSRGSGEFLQAVEKAIPDSDLNSVRGTAWLKQLFEKVRIILQNSPPSA